MGRPSLAKERTEQCLDAFERAIVELGYAGATLEAVADRAGVHRTIIRHYFGGREELVAALLARLRERYAARYRYGERDVPAARRVVRALELMFARQGAEALGMDRVFDALYATGTSDPQVSAFMKAFYRDGLRELSAVLAEAHPSASRTAVRDAATAVMALGVGHSILDTIEPQGARAKRLRRAAEALIEVLGRA